MALPFYPIVSSVGKEAFVSCPFNKEHRMTESSLQRHIIRCMVNYPGYVACPYNASHFFRTSEILEEHIPKCPCKPVQYDGKDIQEEELVHECGDTFNMRYWTEIVDNWDKDTEILEQNIPQHLEPIAFEEKNNDMLIHEHGDLHNVLYWTEMVDNWDK